MKKKTVVMTWIAAVRSSERVMPHSRPTHVLLTALDPWDETELGSSLLQYDPRKSAAGFYREAAARLVAGVKVGAPQIIQDREPLVTTELLYASAA